MEDHWSKNKDEIYINNQIKKLNNIHVFIRHPLERFVSGVHSFIEFEKRKFKSLDAQSVCHMIEHCGLENKHFIQQFFYIKDLFKYFKKTITICSVQDLMDIIPERSTPKIPRLTESLKDKIKKIKYPLDKDWFIFKNFIGKQINIEELIMKVENNDLS